MIHWSNFKHFYSGPTLRKHGENYIPEASDDPWEWENIYEFESQEDKNWWEKEGYPAMVEEADRAMNAAQGLIDQARDAW